MMSFPFASAYGQSGITAPETGATISGDVQVLGTAVIDPFQKYELHYKLEPSGDDAYVYFDGGTNQVINGQLGTWRAAGLPPGIYSLRLRVVKADGNYAEYYAHELSVNQGPAPTPTSSEPTPTPIPTATFTPAPQPTPIVGQVAQPQVEGLAATPTAASVAVASENPTDGGDSAGNVTPDQDTAASLFEAQAAASPVAEQSSFTRELGTAVSIDRLRTFFFTGVRFSATLILGIVALLGGKRLFNWLWMQYR